MSDPYRILGVSPDASPDEIRSAYHRLARQHHPDLNPEPGAEARMRALNWAYEVLTDPRQHEADKASSWAPPMDTRQQTVYSQPRPVTLRQILISLGLSLLIILPSLSAAWKIVDSLPERPTAVYNTPVQAYLAHATRTADAAVLDNPDLPCTAWDSMNNVPDNFDGCFYGLLLAKETLVNDPYNWPAALALGGEDFFLRVLLSPPAALAATMAIGSCVQVRGRVSYDQGGQAEMRILYPERIQPCP